MEIIKLTKDQVAYVYKKSMAIDFPDNERKPLKVINESIDAGFYECIGLVEKDEILGYAFFVRMGNDYLFDYLAIINEYRNKGTGAIFLQKIAEYYKDADSVIGEVENYDYAKAEKDLEIQKRRLDFYLRNDYVDTGVRCWLFGVHYRILELDLGKKLHSKEEIEKLYMEHYRTMLPKLLFKTMVEIEK